MFRNERPPGSEIVDNYEEVLFEDEAQGVFAWMMDGALAHWKELLGKKGLLYPQNRSDALRRLSPVPNQCSHSFWTG
jgi:hypothetical protein